MSSTSEPTRRNQPPRRFRHAQAREIKRARQWTTIVSKRQLRCASCANASPTCPGDQARCEASSKAALPSKELSTHLDRDGANVAQMERAITVVRRVLVASLAPLARLPTSHYMLAPGALRAGAPPTRCKKQSAFTASRTDPRGPGACWCNPWSHGEWTTCPRVGAGNQRRVPPMTGQARQ